MELDNIYFGDCINLMRDIPDKSIDLCVTDAPYLHNKSPLSPTYDGSEWNQKSSFGKSELYKYGGDMMGGMSCFGEEEIDKFLDALKPKMKIMNAYMFCSEEQVPYYCNWANKNSLMFTILVWEKPLSIINKNLFSQNLEYIVRVYDYGTALNRLNNNLYYNRVKKEKPINGKSKNHPTEKPVSIMQEFVELSSNEGDVVLDAFCGSGTLAIACINTNRHFICFEKNKKFFDIAKKRVKERKQQQTIW